MGGAGSGGVAGRRPRHGQAPLINPAKWSLYFTPARPYRPVSSCCSPSRAERENLEPTTATDSHRVGRPGGEHLGHRLGHHRAPPTSGLEPAHPAWAGGLVPDTRPVATKCPKYVHGTELLAAGWARNRWRGLCTPLAPFRPASI